MKQGSIGLISVVLGILIQTQAGLAGTLVEFQGGIGVDPVSRVDGGGPANAVAVPNVVRGVNPGLQPWVIRKFEAKVKENGDIRAEGKGLVQAGGNAIGTPGPVVMVGATLFCGNPGAGVEFVQGAATAHSSGAVPLRPDGDFKIKNELTPSPPDPCTNPVLLIRAGGAAGRWLAAGIPKLEEEDD
ncbi:MAG: hypothetical protein ACREIO_10120 [Nitrospiraceae bacterium]